MSGRVVKITDLRPRPRRQRACDKLLELREELLRVVDRGDDRRAAPLAAGALSAASRLIVDGLDDAALAVLHNGQRGVFPASRATWLRPTR